MQYSTIFGIDSHSRTTTICALVPETGETEKRTFRDNPYQTMREWMDGFPKPAKGVYESGCTGFNPARELSRDGIVVVPIATSKMPYSDDSRKRKNDRRDAQQLAEWENSHILKDVYVPTPEEEGLRDLSNALEDLKLQRRDAYLRVDGILCRHGEMWDQRTKTGKLKKRWGRDFWAWLRSVDLGDAASQAALNAAIRAAESAEEQYRALEAEARKIATGSKFAGTIAALTCLKGVSFLTALAFCAHVGDFDRIPTGRKCTSYFGLAPRDRSSADDLRLGAITRSGCGLVRKLLVECAWSLTRACVSKGAKRPEGVADHVWERSLTLSKRLVEHRRSMLKNKVNKCKANVASAAEIARFMLFLGRESIELERESKAASEGEAA